MYSSAVVDMLQNLGRDIPMYVIDATLPITPIMPYIYQVEVE